MSARAASAMPPAYLSPVPKVWRICEGVALVVLYIVSIGWGDFGTTRPMIQDTMMFGTHLFAAIEDITLNCKPLAIVAGEARRASECAQVYRSLLLALVCMSADTAAVVTQSKHVADDDDDALYATLAFFSALVLVSAIARVFWFGLQWLHLPSFSSLASGSQAYAPVPLTSTTVSAAGDMAPLSTRRPRPSIAYDDMAGARVTARA